MTSTKGFCKFIYLSSNNIYVRRRRGCRGNWDTHESKTGNAGMSCCVKDAKSMKFNEALKSPVASILRTDTSNSITEMREMMMFWDGAREGWEMGQERKTNWRLNCCWFFIDEQFQFTIEHFYWIFMGDFKIHNLSSLERYFEIVWGWVEGFIQFMSLRRICSRFKWVVLLWFNF